jgi:hypothetical protein
VTSPFLLLYRIVSEDCIFKPGRVSKGYNSSKQHEKEGFMKVHPIAGSNSEIHI